MAIAACVLVLVGCGVEPELEPPVPAPTVTTPTPAPAVPESDGPSPYATDQLPERLFVLVSEPVFPDAAREFTTDGAAAFSQYVVDAVNWAYATGDSDPLAAVCDEDSAFCQSAHEHAPQFVGDERVRFGGLHSVEITSVEIYADDGVAFAFSVYSRDGFVDLDREGLLVEEAEADETEVTFHLEFRDGAWFLLGAGRT